MPSPFDEREFDLEIPLDDPVDRPLRAPRDRLEEAELDRETWEGGASEFAGGVGAGAMTGLAPDMLRVFFVLSGLSMSSQNVCAVDRSGRRRHDRMQGTAMSHGPLYSTQSHGDRFKLPQRASMGLEVRISLTDMISTLMYRLCSRSLTSCHFDLAEEGQWAWRCKGSVLACGLLAKVDSFKLRLCYSMVGHHVSRRRTAD